MDNPEICSKCGKNMVDESGFCFSCGHSEYKEDESIKRKRYAMYRKETSSNSLLWITLGAILFISALFILDIFTISKSEINNNLIEVSTNINIGRYEEAQNKLDAIVSLSNLTENQKAQIITYQEKIDKITDEIRLKEESKTKQKEEEKAIKEAFQEYESNLKKIGIVLGVGETASKEVFEVLKNIGIIKIEHIVDTKGEKIKNKEEILEIYKNSKSYNQIEMDRIIMGMGPILEEPIKEVEKIEKTKTYLVIGLTIKNTLNDVIVITENDKIKEIKTDDRVYYTNDDGYLDSLENYALSESEKSEFLILAQNYVKEKLSKPETVKFSLKHWGSDDWLFKKEKDSVEVKSFVNFENEYLSVVKRNFIVSINYEDGTLLFIEIDGE